MTTYPINEVFCSLQGEGANAGRKAVFVRFAGCNLTCERDGEAGFDCDTEFTSNTRLTFDEINDMVMQCWGEGGLIPFVILTGGEPLLHVDEEFAKQANTAWNVAVETNGTQTLPPQTDEWFICVSPKTAEHTLKIQRADELRYVRNHTQGCPQPQLKAKHYWLSPAWGEDVSRNLQQCVRLCKRHPAWRLSMQQHKVWRLP